MIKYQIMRRCILLLVPDFMPSGNMGQVLHLCETIRMADYEVHVCALHGQAELRPEVEFLRDCLGMPYRRLSSSEQVRLKLEKLGVKTHTLQRRMKIDLFAYYALSQLIRKLCPEILHTWGAEALIFSSCVPARMSQRVATLRMLDPQDEGNTVKKLRRAARTIKKMVVNSSGLRDKFSQLGWNVPWRVIPDGVNIPEETEVVPTRRAQLLSRLGLSPEEDVRLVACVGPQRDYKRWEWAVWSLDSIIRVYKNTHLVFFGTGEHLSRVEKFSHQYERSESIHFLRDLCDVPYWLPEFSVFWSPQSCAGASMGILEALACGVPVVACDIPGVKECITHQETGMLVPPEGEPVGLARASYVILGNTQLREKLVYQGLKKVREMYTSQQMADRYLHFYRE